MCVEYEPANSEHVEHESAANTNAFHLQEHKRKPMIQGITDTNIT